MSHDFPQEPSAGGTRVGPRTGADQQPYRLSKSPYFLLMHHPLGWECAEVEGRGLCWLPRLKRLPFAPGVNGVRQGRRGGPPDPSLAIANHTKRGWTFVPEDYDGGFVDRYKCTGGVRYVTKFETPRNIGNRTVIRGDDEAWNKFRLGLVESGVLAGPEPEVLEDLMDRCRNRIARSQKDIHIPAVAEKLEALELTLATMEEMAEASA